MKDNNLCKNSFSIKYIKTASSLSYFIECNEKVFLIEKKSYLLPKMEEFIEQYLNTKLLKNKRANTVIKK